VLTGFIAGGHILLEDVPGTGKTMLCRTFAKAVGGAGFKRVQFTPDLLPSDLTGIHFYNQQAGAFEFRPGPLFTNILLGDEINRATPRTQSALLEAMEERQITVDGETMPLPGIFIVLATQNPIESYGTFPLPEAQLDRFFMRLSLGYMERGDEKDVIARRSTADIIERLTPAVTEDELRFLQDTFHEITVSPEVLEYLMEIITRTRTESNFITGVSTRGAQALYKAGQITAAVNGRGYVIPEDIRFAAPYICAHRLSGGDGKEASALINKIIGEVPVPLETL
jgi:MoxR-like ATPase